ncbi:Chalcone isomerase-like [Andreprevotia lacus DSM 23236]|jgi:hypothetical protein|uniref:Chalcone isomerase-like n=1 Tax=Andreprevotia lacus DSM 23236 TaxID=1121001 RepID=A0A1W1XQM2_9NEIS|nr:chalcone isomerase family protein [Andreprevotia lacus]SMC26155.1 Chalcone isomerase-like [Andreprevotia lacus DSM 23236]
MRWLACLLCVLLVSTVASAGWQDELRKPQLVGEGDFRYFGFRIYSARLWTDAASTPAMLDGASPFALELTYHRDISRDRFVSTSVDEMRRIFGKQIGPAQLERWQTLMQQAFIDVKAGEQLIGLYLPGKGCRFYSAQRELADIADPAFARAFFAIWLDEKTRDPALRRRLLGEGK